MRRAAIALLLLSPLCAPAAARADEHAFPYPMSSETLPNGLRVVTVPMDSPGLFAYFTLVRVGSRNEVEPRHTGFAHFFEHMMFRGTERHPEEATQKLLMQLGLHTNAFTWDDETLYFYAGPKGGLEQVIELEADRFQHLKYAQADFQTEAKAVLGEYNKNASNPAEKMEEVLLDHAFREHTYKHTTIGFKEDILRMPSEFEYSLSFFRRYYRPDACTIFIVGDFDHDAALARIRKEYGGWSGASATPKIPVEPPQAGIRRAAVEWPSDTKPRLQVGWHSPAAGTREATVARVLGPLVFGAASPLYEELVLRRQLVESFEVSYMGDDPRPGHRDPRLFYYLATMKRPEDLAAVRSAVDAAIAELAAGRVDTARLEAVKSHLRYSLLASLETPEEVGELLALFVAPTGDLGAVDAEFARLASVGPADVSTFARRYLVDDNRTEVTLTGKRAGGAR
jgi:zinc protease